MTDNIDQNEVQKFAAIAEQWWDPTGDFKPLHVINPIRAEYISNKIDLKGKKVLDVGCGGGLLAEALFEKLFKIGDITTFTEEIITKNALMSMIKLKIEKDRNLVFILSINEKN